MALTMREDAWATWKPKPPESNKSEGRMSLKAVHSRPAVASR
jgi:hypothetical protein